MQGFRDQIARQYDALVTQTQLEPTIEEPTASSWLSTSTEDFLTPVRADISNAGSWLDLGEYSEETLLPSKGEQTLETCPSLRLFPLDTTKDKQENTSPNPSQESNSCGTRLFPSAQTTPITTTTHSRQSISSTTESGRELGGLRHRLKCVCDNRSISLLLLVESMCAVTEENNKKNATSECSEQRIVLYVRVDVDLLSLLHLCFL